MRAVFGMERWKFARSLDMRRSSLQMHSHHADIYTSVQLPMSNPSACPKGRGACGGARRKGRRQHDWSARSHCLIQLASALASTRSLLDLCQYFPRSSRLARSDLLLLTLNYTVPSVLYRAALVSHYDDDWTPHCSQTERGKNKQGEDWMWNMPVSLVFEAQSTKLV
jgi:hypothetical protein